MLLKNIIGRFCGDKSAQGITEYGAILAFVALLIAAVMGFANGQIGGTLSACFSSVVDQLNSLTSSTS